MKAGLIAVIVAVVVIAGGAFLVMKKDDKKSTTTTPTTQTTSQTPASNANNSNTSSSTQSSSNTPATETVITYSDNGFSPSSITVKSGSKVTIKNTSSHSMQFDSDPHPVHTDDADLNVGVVGSGQSMTFTPNKKGTFGYHNHLNPSDTGIIIVE